MNCFHNTKQHSIYYKEYSACLPGRFKACFFFQYCIIFLNSAVQLSSCSPSGFLSVDECPLIERRIHIICGLNRALLPVSVGLLCHYPLSLIATPQSKHLNNEEFFFSTKKYDIVHPSLSGPTMFERNLHGIGYTS